MLLPLFQLLIKMINVYIRQNFFISSMREKKTRNNTISVDKNVLKGRILKHN